MESIGNLSQINQLLQQVQSLFVAFGFRIAAAIAIFLAGRWLARLGRRLVKRVLIKAQVDPTLISFSCNIAFYAAMAFVTLAALGQVGIETTSLVAVLGAAGLAVGLALQGSLANFASGILIIIFRPFHVGDWVEANGTSGIVDEIQIFTTVLRTLDNRTIIVPNSKLMDDNIVNYSARGKIRVDIVVGVSYDANLDKVRKVIYEILDSDEKVFQDPQPGIGVLELADSSVNFAVRPWTKPEHYWDVYFRTQEELKKRFDLAGIGIPFPQRDLHVYSMNGANPVQQDAASVNAAVAAVS